MKKFFKSFYESFIKPTHHRLIRNTTYSKKVDRKRQGECRRCGECCRLEIVKGIRINCPLLYYDNQNKAICLIYNVKIFDLELRPRGCLLYPISPDPKHWFTKEKCGFYFEES